MRRRGVVPSLTPGRAMCAARLLPATPAHSLAVDASRAPKPDPSVANEIMDGDVTRPAERDEIAQTLTSEPLVRLVVKVEMSIRLAAAVTAPGEPTVAIALPRCSPRRTPQVLEVLLASRRHLRTTA